MKNLYIIYLYPFFLLLPLAESLDIKCRHDDIKTKYKTTASYSASPFELLLRKKALLKLAPLRINMDYSNLNLTGKERETLIKIMEITKNFFAKRLKIIQTGTNTILPSHLSTCFETNVPKDHRINGFLGDIVIYVTAQDDKGDHAAWAGHCLQDAINGRPIAGQVHFQKQTIQDIRTDKDFQGILQVAIHEVIHVLVFSKSLYKDFRIAFGNNKKVDSEEKVLKKVKFGRRNRQLIVTPKVLEAAKKFFACPSMQGVEVEDEGGSRSTGNHWERVILFNEIMGAETMEERMLSVFTLALLEDSGWYKADFSYAEPTYFGKGAGCAFVDRKTCEPEDFPRRKEWCNPDLDEQRCSLSGRFKAVCEKNRYSSCCYHLSPQIESQCEDPLSRFSLGKRKFERYGSDSRCFEANIKEPMRNLTKGAFCMRYSCIQGRKAIEIYINATAKLVCQTAGSKIELPRPYEGSIDCPDPEIYCQNWKCPKDCSSNGYCSKISGCQCVQGWQGKDCSIQTNTNASQVWSSDPCKNTVCLGNRYCSRGTCLCIDGFKGPNCLNICPRNCSGKGLCLKSKCLCDFGHSGEDCSIKEICSKNCNDRGICYKDRCFCIKGFSGSECQSAEKEYSNASACPKNCNKDMYQGYCSMEKEEKTGLIVYKCRCWENFFEPDCSSGPPDPSLECKINCGTHGICMEGACKCELGFYGEDCSQQGCLDECGGRGKCQTEFFGKYPDNFYRQHCLCQDNTKGMYCPPA